MTIYANEIEAALFSPIPQHLMIQDDKDSILPATLVFCHEDDYDSLSSTIHSTTGASQGDVQMLFSRSESQSPPSTTTHKKSLSMPSWQALMFPASPVPSVADLSQTTSSTLKSRIDRRELPQSIALKTQQQPHSPPRKEKKGTAESATTTSTCGSSNILCFMS